MLSESTGGHPIVCSVARVRVTEVTHAVSELTNVLYLLALVILTLVLIG